MLRSASANGAADRLGPAAAACCDGGTLWASKGAEGPGAGADTARAAAAGAAGAAGAARSAAASAVALDGRYLVKRLHTKHTPVLAAAYTRTNVLLCAGAFHPPALG